MADLRAIHAILSDVRATRYWSTPAHAGLEQTSEWLESMVAIPDGVGEDFVVEHAGRVVGKAGFFRFPEIGFIFDPSRWGQGFATEALRVVIARGFEVHGLEAIIADVDPRNIASLHLLAKLGFLETGRRERSWLVGDRWCDSVDLQLTKADFARGLQERPPPSPTT